jgi:hypothetical protein
MISANAARRPTTQPDQEARNKDSHPTNFEEGEREPNERHIGWQPLVTSPQPLSERATHKWLRVEGSNLGTSWEIGIPERHGLSKSLGTPRALVAANAVFGTLADHPPLVSAITAMGSAPWWWRLSLT